MRIFYVLFVALLSGNFTHTIRALSIALHNNTGKTLFVELYESNAPKKNTEEWKEITIGKEACKKMYRIKLEPNDSKKINNVCSKEAPEARFISAFKKKDAQKMIQPLQKMIITQDEPNGSKSTIINFEGEKFMTPKNHSISFIISLAGDLVKLE